MVTIPSCAICQHTNISQPGLLTSGLQIARKLNLGISSNALRAKITFHFDYCSAYFNIYAASIPDLSLKVD